MTYYLFIKEEDIDIVYNILNKILKENSIPHNEVIIKQEEREGVNRGGKYFSFELINITIDILSNMDEVYEEDFEEYGSYLFIYPHKQEDSNKIILTDIANMINFYLKETNCLTHLKQLGK